MVPHTVSVHIRYTGAERRTATAGGAGGGDRAGGDSARITLRLEACGLGPASVMGRGASVFVRDADVGGAAPGDLRRLFGVLPAFPPRGDGGRRRRQGQDDGRGRGDARPVSAPGLRSSGATAGRPSGPEEGEGEEGLSVALAPAPALATTALEHAGTLGGADGIATATATGRRGLQEDSEEELGECTGDCVRSADNRCVFDPECMIPGLVGCWAENQQFCRYCGDGPVYLPCNDGSPTPAPVPTPAPTTDPDRVECSAENASCFENPLSRNPCYDEPMCLGMVSLGCNAHGVASCRFCGLEWEVECPFDLTVTTPGMMVLFLDETVAPCVRTAVLLLLSRLSVTPLRIRFLDDGRRCLRSRRQLQAFDGVDARPAPLKDITTAVALLTPNQSPPPPVPPRTAAASAAAPVAALPPCQLRRRRRAAPHRSPP